MKESQKQSLGQFYKTLRQARGLKQTEVAGKGLSVAQLSKFESGKSMLGADKLFWAVEAIHLSITEFVHAYTGGDATSFSRLTAQIASLTRNEDVEGLKNLLQDNRYASNYEVYNQLTLLVIKHRIQQLEPDYIIDKADEKLLVDYLFRVDDWTMYEFYLFGNLLSRIPDGELLLLLGDFPEKVKLYGTIHYMSQFINSILINIISELSDRKKFFHALTFIEMLDDRTTEWDIYEKIIIRFFSMFISYKQKKQDLQELKDYLAQLEVLGNQTLIALFQSKLVEKE